MKKGIILFIIFLVFIISSNTYALEELDLTEFNNEIRKYGSKVFPEISDKDIISEISSGNIDMSAQNVFERILSLITSEFKSNLFIIFKIIGIVVLCAILKNIQSSFGENGVSEVAFYVCYILVIILITTTFSSITAECIKSIDNLSNFMNVVIPIMLSLLLITGNLTSVAFIQPVIVAMTSIITNIFSKLIIPLIFIGLVINIVSNISNKVSFKNLGNLFKKTAVWIIEIMLIVFIGVLSLEGTLTSSVDGITAKTAKSVVSSTVPVVGKLLGDAVDSVIGGTVITKNAIGLIGIIVIIAIVIVPIIKTFILMMVFNLTSSLIEPIADERIVKTMSNVGETIKILFGIMTAISFLFIISITLIIKVSNFSIMYR